MKTNEQSINEDQKCGKLERAGIKTGNIYTKITQNKSRRKLQDKKISQFVSKAVDLVNLYDWNNKQK
jgi:hypothetical protein